MLKYVKEINITETNYVIMGVRGQDIQSKPDIVTLTYDN